MARLAEMFSVGVEGIQDIQKKLNAKTLTGVPLKNMLKKSAYKVKRQTQIYSPVETGNLRANWKVRIDSKSVPLWVQVGTFVEYAKTLEESGKSPRPPAGPTERIPFFRPAIVDTEGDRSRFVEEAKREIEANWRK
ncbi:MAG: hypothetical protein SVK08_00570 [Halobacteriota archaeon]|nr:hypothetical protein [Halobacteriota archaeon]